MEAGALKKSSSLKNEITASYLEVDSKRQHLRKKITSVNMIDGLRISITALALCFSISVLGISANAISVYNSTRLEETGWLSIWPASFDLRPTIALLAGSCVVMIANIAGLLCSKVPNVNPPSWSTIHEAQLIVIDPQQHAFSYSDDVCGPLARLHSLHDCHDLLLRHQFINNCRYPPQLDVPVEIRYNGHGALLWDLVQLQLGFCLLGSGSCSPRGRSPLCCRLATQG